MMLASRERQWSLLPALTATLLALSSLFACAVSASPSPSDFTVHSISVNHELGGAHHKLSQLHLVQQPDDPVRGKKYYIGLSSAEASSLSQNEVNLKYGPGIEPFQRATTGLRAEGSVAGSAGSADLTHLYSLELPDNFLEKSPEGIVTPNITISIDFLFHRLASPLPKLIGQSDSASLLWEGDSVPRTPYGANKVRVKAR